MGTGSRPASLANIHQERASFWFPLSLAVFVLVSRILCRGSLYYLDGPVEVASILDKSYIIQPPGYWLFNRIAGLFSNPVLAITSMNILFSVAGVVVFYYAACFFTTRRIAFLAAFAYSTVFYLWFSGEVHSTYATQIFFPIATWYLLLRYDRDRAHWLLWLAALVFATGTGMRPTDGVFMLPMLFYYAVKRLSLRERIILFSVIPILCLGWIVPTWLAYRNFGNGTHGVLEYLSYITRKESIFTGVRAYALANPVRYAMALLVAFWPIAAVAVRNAIRHRGDWQITALVLWIVPGSLFFIFVLISAAPYLNFLTAAVLLLAISDVSVKTPKLLTTTALWNCFVFLFLSPIPSRKLSVNIVNSFVLRTTRGAINQHYTATLSEMQHLNNVE